MKLELLQTVRVRTWDSPRAQQRIADKRRPARYGLRGSASTSPRERQAVEWTAALCPTSWGGATDSQSVVPAEHEVRAPGPVPQERLAVGPGSRCARPGRQGRA